MQIQNSSGLYTNNRIIVDVSGDTPYSTIQDAITYAATLGGTQDIFIRPGIYAENLILTGSCNLIGENPNNTVINGNHTLPAANDYSFSNLYLSRLDAGALFTEPAATTGTISFNDCTFAVLNGLLFDAATSAYDIFIIDCDDFSITNTIANCTLGNLDFRNSTIGAGAVAAVFSCDTIITDCTFNQPISITEAFRISGSQITGAVDASVTANPISFLNTRISSGAAVALTITAPSVVSMTNCTIDSSNVVHVATGTGTINLSNVNFADENIVDVVTKVFDSLTQIGSLRISDLYSGALYADAGVVDTVGAMTDGELLIGSTGNPPVAATITAGAGITVTNGAGTISIAASTLDTWTTIAADGPLTTNTSYIDTKAGLLSVSLPAASAQGDMLRLQGHGAGGWIITQGVGQQILIAGTNTTLGAGGTLASSNLGDGVSMVCTTANLEWRVYGVIGNLTVV